MSLKLFTKEQRKQINTIMNVDSNLTDEDDVIAVALKFTAEMCDPEYLESDATFYVDTDCEGYIKLEVVV